MVATAKVEYATGLRQPILTKLRNGFNFTENRQFETTLELLLPHIRYEKTVIAGGIALRHYLTSKGYTHPSPTFKDIDLLIGDPKDIFPSVTEPGSGFLISHYHPPDHYPNLVGNFFIKMIYVPTGAKIDFFSYTPFPPEYFQPIDFNGQKMQIPRPESLLIVTLLDTIKALDAHGKAPAKRLVSIDLLLKIADMEKAETEWKEKFSGEDSLRNLITQLYALYETNKEIFVNKIFGKNHISGCNDCVNDPRFPIASREAVREALGIKTN